MSLPGRWPGTEVPGWLWQILIHALHVDLREAMSADRLHQEDPLRLSVGRPGILLALGKYLITGDKLQAAQVVASSRDPLTLASGHPQAPHRHHHRHHHPFLHLLIIYQPTHSTQFRNRLPSNQFLTTLVLWKVRSGAMSHLFSLLSVEDMAVEAIALGGGILEEGMELVWPQCSQALPLILLMIATVTTSRMVTGPILWCLHVLPNHRLQMVWTTDTPTVSTTGTPLLLSLPPMPTRPLP